MTKQTKTTAAVTTSVVWDHKIIGSIAGTICEYATAHKTAVDAVLAAERLHARINELLTEFRTYDVKLGKSRRTCAISKEFFAAFVSLGVKETTAGNYLTDLRNAINDGNDFILNSARHKKLQQAASEEKQAAKAERKAEKKKTDSAMTDAEVLAILAKQFESVRNRFGADRVAKALSSYSAEFNALMVDFFNYADGGEDETSES